MAAALLVFPSLYTWYNVVGFWDPYGSTGDMRVGVVNEDEGAATALTGYVNAGDKLVAALSENTQIHFVFDSYDTCMADVESGRDFAVFVIPTDFTEKLLTITTGSFEQPQIRYYVNEKTGPVASKITDTVSSTVERQLNEEIVSTVSDVVVDALTTTLGDVQATVTTRSSEALAIAQDADDALAETSAKLGEAKTTLAAARAKHAEAVEALDRASAALEATDAKLGTASAKLGELQNGLAAVTPEASHAVNEALVALSELEGIAQAVGKGDELRQSIARLEQASSALLDVLVPSVGSGLATLQASGATLKAAAQSQQATIVQTRIALDQMDLLISSAETSLDATQTLLDGTGADLADIRTDLAGLSGSQSIKALLGADTAGGADGTGADAGDTAASNIDAIADFIGSPTQVSTERLFAANSFGAGMAPLFMNLTLWIGGFMILIVMKLEVDGEGVKRLTVPQRYLSRFLLFAGMVVLQAIICVAGTLVLGVEAVNVPALFLAAVCAALAFLSIAYALSVMFQHVGMGLCIILCFLQIPAATGLYPLELTAGFYRAVSPFFPFTYGIGAMREAICGFYGSYFVRDIAALCVFFALFLALGLTLHPLLSNVNRTFARQIAESGLFNGEKVEVPERRVRISQILNVLADKDEFRRDVELRYARFLRLYPRIIRGTLIAGLAVPAVLGIAFSLTAGEKATLLGLWLGWAALLFVFLAIVENMRTGLERQLELDGLSADDLRGIFVSRQDVSAAFSRMQTHVDARRAARRNAAEGEAADAGADADAEGADADAGAGSSDAAEGDGIEADAADAEGADMAEPPDADAGAAEGNGTEADAADAAGAAHGVRESEGGEAHA